MSAFAESFPLLDDAAVESLLPMRDAIEALREAFAEQAAGTASTMTRTRVLWEDGRLQAMGGYMRAASVAATKTWAVTPGGGQPVVVLFSTDDGSVQALMESRHLSRLRTGAASGLATDLLAPEGADRFALIGTGRQALAQAEAVCAVRPIELVRVVARDRPRTQAFAEMLERRLGVHAEAVTDVAAAARAMPIVTAITDATAPVLWAENLEAESHVNGAGTILPSQGELGTDIFSAASLIAVDDVQQAASEAGDLQRALQSRVIAREALRPLAQLVAARPARPRGITVFKSVGVGLEDVAIAHAVWQAHVAATNHAHAV